MYLKPTATVNLGLLMFFAQEDSKFIREVNLEIINPSNKPNALLSTENVNNASAEVELSLCHCGFRAKVVLDEKHWDEFIMTFFQNESVFVPSEHASYSYKNEAAYNWCEGYGTVWETSHEIDNVNNDNV